MKHIVFDLSNVYSPSTANKNVVVETKREMPTRCECAGCNKKLILTDLECKCKKYFCKMHRYATDHVCEYDYRAESLKNLEKNMVKVEADKLEKI